MIWRGGRWAWILPALAVVLVLVANGLVFQAKTQTLVDDNAKAMRSQLVLSILEQVRTNVVDAETGQRGYLLTGQSSYLAPYTAANAKLGTLLTKLGAAISDNPAQQRYMHALVPLIDAKLHILRSTIDLRRARGAAAAIRLVIAGTGQNAMVKIRGLVDTMWQEESTLLATRTDDVNTAIWATRITLVLATAIDVILLTGLILLLQRNATRAARVAEERSELLEREHAAHADAERERARLEAFFEAMIDAVVIYDRDGTVLQANTSMRRLFALDKEQSILTQPVRERATRWDLRQLDGSPLPPDQWPVHKLLAGSVLTGDRSIDMLVRTLDGRDVLVNASGAPLYNAEGKVDAAICVFRDETERRRLEQAVRVERDTLRQVLDVMPEAVLVADATPRFQVSNQVANAMLGVDVVGQKLRDFNQHDPDSYRAWRLNGTPFPSKELPLERALFHGEIVNGLQYIVRNAASKRNVPVLANSAPIRDADGKILGAVVVFQDISAIKDLEQQKNDFLATIAHDLKNPLTVIAGLSQVLLRRANKAELAGNQRLWDGLVTIDRTARTMAQLVSALLDSSRLQMGQALHLDLQTVDLVPLLRETVPEYAQSSPNHRVQFTTTEQHLICRCDRARVQRAVANVLSNAIKYSPSGGAVAVTLQGEPAVSGAGAAYAAIQVSDQGMGIPASDIPRVFERFFRGANVAHIDGTGIGLAGVRQIVEQHGGTIAIESVQGMGTTVTMRLPLAGPPATDTAMSSSLC